MYTVAMAKIFVVRKFEFAFTYPALLSSRYVFAYLKAAFRSVSWIKLLNNQFADSVKDSWEFRKVGAGHSATKHFQSHRVEFSMA